MTIEQIDRHCLELAEDHHEPAHPLDLFGGRTEMPV